MKKFLIKIVVLISLFFMILVCNSVVVYSKENIQMDRLEEYWWGCRRYISSENIIEFSNKLDLMAAEYSILGGATIPIHFINPTFGILIGSIFELSSAYCWLLSTKLLQIDEGRGVIIEMSKGLFFRIKKI